MAFPKATGYQNLPNGNFSPIIYSKQVQLAFRKSSVVEDITNSDYFGEIANMGDSVKIIKEPEVSVQSYARGTQITAQDLDDEDFTLVVDQSNYYAFKIDDIEAAHSHVNFMSLASDRAAYRLRDQYDQDVLGYLCGFEQSAKHGNADSLRTTSPGTNAVASAGSNELLSSMVLNKGSFSQITTGSAGDHSIPLATRLPGATSLPNDVVSPLQVISRMGRLLDYGGSGLQNGLVINNLHGFKVYSSNNLPTVGGGPATGGKSNQNTDFGVIVGGHGSAVATAQQVSKTESYRDPDSFADIVRGMHLYGRKILRPEALVTAKYNVA
jgi:hypothetical protein